MITERNPNKYAGVPIIGGKGYGKAVVIDAQTDIFHIQNIDREDVEKECSRFSSAREETKKYYSEYSSKIAARDNSDVEHSIVEMYKVLADDPSLIVKVIDCIALKLVSAESAVRIVAQTEIDKFQKDENEFFRDRGKDIEEVRDKILHFLSGESAKSKAFEGSVVLVVKRSLLLSDIISNNTEQIKAIVCESSGKTSHAVIVARSNSIPIISDVDFTKLQIETGIDVLVDCDNEMFIVSPSQEQLSKYNEYISDVQIQKHEMPEYIKFPVYTRDGKPVLVTSNISLESDAKLAVENGADGIGLVRTEVLFIQSSKFPSEEKQMRYYSRIFDSVGERRKVCIRVMDIGGDKMAKFLTIPEEKNPFMGYRAVRIYREKRELLETQLRAIMKAGQNRKYGIMFPMITTLSEWEYLRNITCEVAENLGVECPELGILFEVPLAILGINLFLDSIDFASIGTNDLIQYLSAADRGNAKVNYLYNPIEAAFLRIIKNAIDECISKGKPVSMCGDMAARPEYTILLLGLGLTRFSVAPPMVPIIKEIIASVSFIELKEEVGHMLSNMRNTEAIADWIDNMNEKYCREIFNRYHFVPKTREV